jgi:uncharacterized membrane protein YgcG
MHLSVPVMSPPLAPAGPRSWRAAGCLRATRRRHLRRRASCRSTDIAGRQQRLWWARPAAAPRPAWRGWEASDVGSQQPTLPVPAPACPRPIGRHRATVRQFATLHSAGGEEQAGRRSGCSSCSSCGGGSGSSSGGGSGSGS